MRVLTIRGFLAQRVAISDAVRRGSQRNGARRPSTIELPPSLLLLVLLRRRGARAKWLAHAPQSVGGGAWPVAGSDGRGVWPQPTNALTSRSKGRIVRVINDNAKGGRP